MNEKELRELDAWIAEHVMGWKWVCHTKPVGIYVGKRWLLSPEDQASNLGFGWELTTDENLEVLKEGWLLIPHYTTDRAAAMEVLEKCAAKRLEAYDPYCPNATLVIHAPHEDWNNKWVVASNPEHSIVVEAESLPLAICLFAQKLFSK